MVQVTNPEEYKAVVAKYGERLKVARLKYEEFKRELATLEKALAVPAPATASEPARKTYEWLQDLGKIRLKDIGRFIDEYDDLFDRAVRTIKLYR